MKEYGLYLWRNVEKKLWTVTNDEDALLLALAFDDDNIKEHKFKSTKDRINYEKKLDEEGYLFCSLETFVI